MKERKYVDGKLMRYGYTTGSCAAAAAKAAVFYILSGKPPRTVSLTTPKGKVLNLLIEKAALLADGHGDGDGIGAECAVRKDAGDDPDVTHGTLIFSRVRLVYTENVLHPGHAEVRIDGGAGIGRVTKAGLDQPVGAAAINSGPRAMIRQAVEEALEETLKNIENQSVHPPLLSGVTKALQEGRLRLDVLVSAPEGEALGKRTFNPMMGIEGGISILGTTGIVEPMSDQAIAGTIEAEVSVIAAAGHRKLMINLGNYGENFTTKYLGLGTEPSIKCANFIGVAVDAAVAEGLDHILLIGHIGKLVKLGISMFNTHSNNGDGRLETFAACAVEAGLEIDVIRKVLECATTEAAVDVLDEGGHLDIVLERLKERIRKSIERHVPDSVRMEFICFSGKIGQWRPLFRSDGADEMCLFWKSESK